MRFETLIFSDGTQLSSAGLLTYTVLEYECRCQKDCGFFFFPISFGKRLMEGKRCSERDGAEDHKREQAAISPLGQGLIRQQLLDQLPVDPHSWVVHDLFDLWFGCSRLHQATAILEELAQADFLTFPRKRSKNTCQIHSGGCACVLGFGLLYFRKSGVSRTFLHYTACFFFLGPLGLEVGFRCTPLRKWVLSNFSKKTNNHH